MPYLQRFTTLALNWLSEHLQHFDPFLEGQRPNLLRSKALLELALLCFFYNRVVPSNGTSHVERFLDFIYEVWQRHEYHALPVRTPHHFRLYAMIYIVLATSHRVDKSFGAVLQRIIDDGYVTALEHEPFRRLELRYILDSGGIKHSLPPPGALYKDTLLAKLPPLPYLTEYDVYAITHTIYYISDFSLRQADIIPKHQYRTVCDYINLLLGFFARKRHWDLVAELLLCCLCLRSLPPLLFDTSWQFLVHAQRDDGSVPGPVFAEKAVGQLEGDVRRADYTFRHNYHTTVVSVLAAVLTNQRQI